MSEDVERADKMLKDLRTIEIKLVYLDEVGDRIEKKTEALLRRMERIAEKLDSIEFW